MKKATKKSENKIALVTGASNGIGRVIAVTLAESGYDIIVHYHLDQKSAKEVAQCIRKLKRNAYIAQADLTKDKQTVQMFTKISKQHRKLDLVVNNAGYDYGKLIEDYSFEEMRYVIDIVLLSKLYVTKLALPLLKQSNSASIINIASRMGKEKTIRTIAPYGAAEAGVIKLTQAAALEFSDYNIRVNCVAPGLIRTRLSESILTDADWEYAAQTNPTHRVGAPQDIANAVEFLASDKASYINGETIGVNGGSNLG